VRREFPEAKLARLEVNAGAASARNAALRMASGEFVAFLDSDDAWLPGKIGARLAFLENNPDVAVCATGHVFCRRDGVCAEGGEFFSGKESCGGAEHRRGGGSAFAAAADSGVTAFALAAQASEGWRRGESNPCPSNDPHNLLHV